MASDKTNAAWQKDKGTGDRERECKSEGDDDVGERRDLEGQEGKEIDIAGGDVAIDDGGQGVRKSSRDMEQKPFFKLNHRFDVLKLDFSVE